MEGIKSIADLVRFMRHSLFLDQKSFGELLGVTRSAICHIETGRKKPGLPVRKKMYELSKKNKFKMVLEDFLI